MIPPLSIGPELEAEIRRQTELLVRLGVDDPAGCDDRRLDALVRERAKKKGRAREEVPEYDVSTMGRLLALVGLEVVVGAEAASSSGSASA